jgi:hypothetical protein
MSNKSNQDIKDDLKNLWKATVDGFDEIKDVIVKGSQAGQARIDAAFLERERANRLQELGELVYRFGPKEGQPASWHEKFNEIRDLDKKLADQREQFDHLVRDVKDAVPDLGGSDGDPEEEAPPPAEAPPAEPVDAKMNQEGDKDV